jgi:chloramphenicol O-acetyltransferase type A
MYLYTRTPSISGLCKEFITFATPYQKITTMREINPKETTRAYAFEMWMQAPNPMVTFFKTLNVSRLMRISRRKGLKFNMLMCYCIGRAASAVKEFYMLPVNGKLMQFDTIAVNTIVANSAGEVSSCDLPFSKDLAQFNRDYLRLTKQVAESCTDHDLSEQSMVIGTSALAQYEIDGAVGMYSGIFCNPFMIWGKYKCGLFKTTLTVSFQFHHTQMDGAHAAKFLDLLQREIDGLKG